jgi:hypothetical protein
MMMCSTIRPGAALREVPIRRPFPLFLRMSLRGGGDDTKNSGLDDGLSQTQISTNFDFLPDIVKQLVKEDDDDAPTMPSAERYDRTNRDRYAPTRGHWNDSDIDVPATMSLEEIGEFDIETPEGRQQTENVLKR